MPILTGKKSSVWSSTTVTLNGFTPSSYTVPANKTLIATAYIPVSGVLTIAGTTFTHTTTTSSIISMPLIAVAGTIISVSNLASLAGVLQENVTD